MSCPACGRYNSAGLRACVHCGAALVFDCPSCGAYNQSAASRCRVCGKTFEGLVVLAAADRQVASFTPRSQTSFASGRYGIHRLTYWVPCNADYIDPSRTVSVIYDRRGQLRSHSAAQGNLMNEVRPWLRSLIWIRQFKTVRELSIVDFSSDERPRHRNWDFFPRKTGTRRSGT